MVQRDRVPRSPRILAILTTLFAALFATAAGCGDDGDDPELRVDPSTLSLAKGRTSMATAKVDGRAAGSAVSWRSINPSVATVVEGANGAATITAVGVGETKVIVKLEEVSATMIVTVSEAEIDAIAITPAAPQVAAGTAADLTATATLSDMTTRNVTAQVTWRSSDVAKATIDAAGKLRGLVKGPTTVTATLGALTATANATVTDAVLTAIAVTPVNLSLPKGLTRQMTATGTFSDASTQDITNQVTWASSATANAAVSAAGVVTGAGVGNAMISATKDAITGQVAVEITAAVLQSIALTPVNSELAKGLSREFTATGTFSDATTQDLSATAQWASSNAAVATTDGRNVTAVSEGNATISATQAGITGTTGLEVTAAVITTIQVTPANSELAKGLTRQFTATALLSDGSNMNITTTATWASSDMTHVAISNADGSRGLATALLTGPVTISATQGGVTGTTGLEVTPAALVSLEVTPATFTLQLAGTQQLTAIGTFTDTTTVDLTDQVSWSSSTTATSVSATGLVTGVSAGESDITAAMNGITDSSHATVNGATLVSIAVTPATTPDALPVGLTRQYTATGTYSDGDINVITDQVTWTSSDTDTAQISNAAGSHGLATALAPGDTTITATLDGVSGTATLDVVAVTLESITVTPVGSDLPVGIDMNFRADGHYNDGSTQNLTTSVTWLSSNESAATISNVDGSRGLAHGVAIGTTTITATMDSITSNAAPLNVVAPVIVSIAVTPPGDLARGTSRALTATATYSDGTALDVTELATWASSDAAALTVSDVAGSKGLATAVTTAGATVTATLGAVNASLAIAGCNILINEVQLAGVSGSLSPAANEWIEIASGCTATQNLTGLRLIYRSSGNAGTDFINLSLNGTIAPNEYKFYVSSVHSATYPTASDAFPTNATGQLAGAAGGVALRIGAAGAIVDSLGYGPNVTNGLVEGTSSGVPAGGSSVARIPNRTDTNNNSADFAIRATPTPGAAN